MKTLEDAGNEVYDIIEKELKGKLSPADFDSIAQKLVKGCMLFYEIGMREGVKQTQEIIKAHLGQNERE